jgi:mannonate dehydratase
MIKIAEILPGTPTPLWNLVRQCGIQYVVGMMDLTWGVDGDTEEKPWSYTRLLELKNSYASQGLELAVLESRPPMEAIKLGLPERDAQLEQVCDLIRNMGKVGIPVWCYEWMPIFNWMRTSTTTPTRGGALATAFDYATVANEPPTEYGVVSEERLWENLEYFLRRVVPVAEAAGVQLAMHPDDPPLSGIRGLGRIMRSVENFQRLIDTVPSPNSGVTLCQGNFTLMTPDVPATIRSFGRQNKIFFVHLRDVRGVPSNFVETFHDAGQTDMLACMQAYHDIGFEGVLRPDHVPTMEGDSNDTPAYSSIGRLFAIGYIKGLREAVYGKAAVE